MANISMKLLLEAGVHFGHQTNKWNPKMKPYIFGARNGIYIIDLQQTVGLFQTAYQFIVDTVAGGGEILFVGTKKQAQESVHDESERCSMPYVHQRWLGGMLTNFAQMQKRVYKLKDLKAKRESGELKKYTKREQLLIDREIAQLEKFLGGVADMGKLPDALLVVDTHREEVAVREANKMGIPVVGMVDTNGDPARVDYIIPVNDDAVKSIELVVKAVASAIKK